MKKDEEGARTLVARTFTWVEDVVYVGLGTLMIVELLYTVQVSLREHTLVPEPFLIVGMMLRNRTPNVASRLT